jgi:hypothetical protein
MEDELAGGGWREDAVEKYRVKMWIQPQVGLRPLHDRDGSALPATPAALAEYPSVPAEHGSPLRRLGNRPIGLRG